MSRGTEDVEYRLEVRDDYEPAGPSVAPVESVESRAVGPELVEPVGDDVGADVVGMDVEREPLERAPFPSVEGYSVAIQRRMSVVYGHLVSAMQREVVVQLGGDKVVVSRPSSARDDVTNFPLDPGMTFDGMLRELEALESLKVGDVVWERGNEKVITTRWVCSAKTERVEGRERHIVRCRVVARDFAQGCSAAQLGISSPTSSAEALRTFLRLAATKRWNIVGLDVSAAFLFADLEEDGRVLVSLPDGVQGKGGEKDISASGRPCTGFVSLRSSGPVIWQRSCVNSVG